MKARKGRKKKANTWKVSLAWECETSSLPRESGTHLVRQPLLQRTCHPGKHHIFPTACRWWYSFTRFHGHYLAVQRREVCALAVAAGLFLALETFKSQPFEEKSWKEVDTAWDHCQAESFAKIGVSAIQIALTSANWVGYARRCQSMNSAVARSYFTLVVGDRIHNRRSSMISTNWWTSARLSKLWLHRLE